MDDRLKELAKYRIEKAEAELETAGIMIDNDKYPQSINRSYYAMFHAVRALLALDKFDSRKHSGIIAYFNQNYVKPGNIEVEYSKMLTSAFKIRSDSDYKDFYVVSRTDAEFQFGNAKKFIKRIKELLKNIL